MRTPIRLILSLSLLSLGFGAVAAPSAAHAQSTPDSIHAYFEGVGQLLPAVDEWRADLDAQLSAMVAKPELACGDEFAALVRRGHGLVEDLRGTGTLAPSMLQARHEAAVDGLEHALAGLELILESCDRAAGAEQIAEGHAEYAKAMRLIRYYAARLG